MGIRTFCIHGHFYQPPREDPLTGVIPYEPGAAPFPNWNERIHAECYRPNADLRNFEHISFNIGPTLSHWMHRHDPHTSQKIAEQDRTNLQRNGVGNAMAQAYNHTILPLASWKDKLTQIYWGIADFQYRFGHKPQGMWLPETAADLETLEALALNGIEFTILAPWQAAQTEIDPAEPYTVTTPSKRPVTVFFYQPELSARVSFDAAATTNADIFAAEMLSAAFQNGKAASKESQMLMIASDGELYGHHQQLRSYFLARLVDGATSSLGIRPTYPALWLKHFQPRQSVSIREQTSWSCHHGVLRWLGSCPCTPGDGNWKAQMRYAFERLASELDALYLNMTRGLVSDPWLLRNRYIHVLLGEMRLENLLGVMCSRSLTSQQSRRLHLMLEAQRERQRMFTSCGWFFEDFDRIEPKNNVAYAAQAVRLARLASGVDLAPALCSELGRAASPITGLRADQVFMRHIQRAEGVREVRLPEMGD